MPMSDAGTIERPNARAAVPVTGERLSFEDQLRQRADTITAMLPSDVSRDRFLNSVIAAVRNKPDILSASVRSVFAAITEAAQDGLLPDGKEGVINIYNTKRRGQNGQPDQWVPTAKWMPMIHGIRKRARELDQLIINAQIVYENDEWDWEEGDNPHIQHRPPKKLGASRGAMLGAYAIFKREVTGEILHREVMSADQIADVQKQSKDPDGLMWKKFTTEAWRKTVVRRGIKTVPCSAGLETVVRRDDDTFNFAQERVPEALTPPSPPSAPPSPPPAPKAITDAPAAPASVVEQLPQEVEAELDRATLREMKGESEEQVEPDRDELAEYIDDMCREADKAKDMAALDDIDDRVCAEIEHSHRETLRPKWNDAYLRNKTRLKPKGKR